MKRLPQSWYQYLIDGKEKPSAHQKKCSLSIATSRTRQRKGWLLVRDDADTFAQLPEQPCNWVDKTMCSFWTRTVSASADILKDTVCYGEYDFNLRLSILVGQAWADLAKEGQCLRLSEQNRRSLELDPRRGIKAFIAFLSTLSVGIEQAGLDLTSNQRKKLVSVDWKVKINCKTSLSLLGNGAMWPRRPSNSISIAIAPIQDWISGKS